MPDQHEFSTEERQRATIAVLEVDNQALRERLTYAQALLFRQAEVLAAGDADALTDAPGA